jgi:hypothetical protein
MDGVLYKFYLRVGLGSGKENTCDDKKKIASESEARKLAQYSTESFQRPMGYYPCIFCGYWHVGGRIPFEEMLRLEKKGQAILLKYKEMKQNDLSNK